MYQLMTLPHYLSFFICVFPFSELQFVGELIVCLHVTCISRVRLLLLYSLTVLSLSLPLYIYIYMCVCVCVCVCA